MFRDERGAVTVTVLSILPLVLGVLITVAALFYVLRTHSAILHLCRTEVLEAETERLEYMRELIKLNPEAKRLRATRAAAEKSLRLAQASQAAPAVAAAQTARAAVIAKQLALAAKQKGLLTKTKVESELAFSKLKNSLLTKVKTDVQVYEASQGAVIGNFQAEIRPLAVVALPPADLTPDYQAHSRFSETEIIRLSWKFWPARLLPKWFGSLARVFNDLTIQGQCAATGERKGNHQWRSRLTVDKRP